MSLVDFTHSSSAAPEVWVKIDDFRFIKIDFPHDVRAMSGVGVVKALRELPWLQTYEPLTKFNPLFVSVFVVKGAGPGVYNKFEEDDLVRVWRTVGEAMTVGGCTGSRLFIVVRLTASRGERWLVWSRRAGSAAVMHPLPRKQSGYVAQHAAVKRSRRPARCCVAHCVVQGV